jgi:nitric oxide reductase NorE protein
MGTAAPAAPHLPGEAGVWVFIFGDMFAFTVMFGAFMYEQRRTPGSFRAAQQALDVTIGSMNTVLLLTGSLLVVTGVRATRATSGRATVLFGVGFACGLCFVINKWVEFSSMISAGDAPAVGGFYAYFFFMAGVHLLHVLGGMVVLAYVAAVARKPALGAAEIRRVENGASYWHLVDVLWIILFPLLYLVH